MKITENFYYIHAKKYLLKADELIRILGSIQKTVRVHR